MSFYQLTSTVTVTCPVCRNGNSAFKLWKGTAPLRGDGRPLRRLVRRTTTRLRDAAAAGKAQRKEAVSCWAAKRGYGKGRMSHHSSRLATAHALRSSNIVFGKPRQHAFVLGASQTSHFLATSILSLA